MLKIMSMQLMDILELYCLCQMLEVPSLQWWSPPSAKSGTTSSVYHYIYTVQAYNRTTAQSFTLRAMFTQKVNLQYYV